jgi:hypothetical protein
MTIANQMHSSGDFDAETEPLPDPGLRSPNHSDLVTPNRAGATTDLVRLGHNSIRRHLAIALAGFQIDHLTSAELQQLLRSHLAARVMRNAVCGCVHDGRPF